MSMKTLHILNGDATLAVFEQTSFEGDRLVWREILSEGPVSKTELWQTRSEWICASFGESEINYQKNVLDEVTRLKDLSAYDTLVLWFEYDLVCQVNLSYILSLLRETHNSYPDILLICPDKFEGKPHFRGLGELNSTELSHLYTTRKELTLADLDLAYEAWNCYLEDEPQQLKAFLQNDFGNLPNLKKALSAHLLRFPDPITQLNYIEETLLALIKNGITKRKAIYEAFWLKESIFGLTDLLIDQLLDQLQAKGLIEKDTLK